MKRFLFLACLAVACLAMAVHPHHLGIGLAILGVMPHPALASELSDSLQSATRERDLFSGTIEAPLSEMGMPPLPGSARILPTGALRQHDPSVVPGLTGPIPAD